MHYRKEIDGLRAIAIIPVIWVHAGLPFFTGGFLGVDVFFVISGFLITSILFKEFESNSFTLLKFYERRARRILPALLAVIIVTSFVVPLISVHPKFLGDYGNSVLSTILFSSNIYFWQTSGYFGSASELSPMLHTWSLAVEEQYYIFFPLLLMVLFSHSKKVVVSALILIFIVSLLISEWGAINSPIANFYLLPSRVWELLAGVLASIFYYNASLVKIRNKYSNYLSVLGIIFISISYFLFSPLTLHPASLTILPVLGAVLVLLFSAGNNIVGKLLSMRPFVFIGLISYSLYLWHQPIFALMKKSYSLHLEISQTLFGILLTFILSYLTWKFVETPFRNKQQFSQFKIFKLSIASIVIVAVVGFFLRENLQLQKIVFPEKMARFEQLLEAEKSHLSQVMYDDDNCKFWSEEFNEKFINRFEKCKNSYDKAIFVLGGSHGMDLYNAIASSTAYPFVVSVSKGFCRAHRFIGSQKNLPKCQYDDFLSFAKVYSKNISNVLYTQTPDRLFKINSLEKATPDDLSLELIDEVVRYLAKLKEEYLLDVIMIGMLPPLKISPIDWSFEQPFSSQFNDIISVNSMELAKLVDNAFAIRLSNHEIAYISKIDAFSLSLPNDLLCKGKITYSDNRHISSVGEREFGSRLVEYMGNLGFRTFSVN